ncbi:sigma-70 family RNA polymerase sigma factor [Candidatus Chloroploca asiatica]|nr:sigma-70 family RNA polymerase sigma factor [Candidatus Chloroploca asiatica]
MKLQHSWYDVVVACQERVQRIRASLTSGGTLTLELQADREAVILAIRNWVLGRAKHFPELDEDGVSEVLLKTIQQLDRDLRSPGFGSMESMFGSYVKTTVHRILFEILGKNKEQRTLSASERLDAQVGKGGLARHEVIEDVTPERLADEYREEQLHARLHAAIAQLPPHDREVINLRLQGVPSIEIARRMNLSPVNITRIYNRVVERLRQILTVEEH